MSEVFNGAVAPVAPEAVSTETAENQQTPETQAAEPKQDFLAPKFAALTRKEKQIRAEEARIKAERAEIQKMREEFETKSKSTQDQEASLLADMKKNPLKFMEKHGLTFEELMQMQMNDQNPTPEMQLQRMRDELRAEMEEKYGKLNETLKQKEEREARERYDAAINGYQSELSAFIEQHAEEYELTANNDGTRLMFETAQAYYEQTGRVPSNEELAKAVEEHLEEQIAHIAKLKKVQSKFGTSSAPKTEAKPEKTAQTLSNTLAAEVPKGGNKLLSDEQSKREAAKLLRWE